MDVISVLFLSFFSLHSSSLNSGVYSMCMCALNMWVLQLIIITYIYKEPFLIGPHIALQLLRTFTFTKYTSARHIGSSRYNLLPLQLLRTITKCTITTDTLDQAYITCSLHTCESVSWGKISFKC